MKKLFVTVLLIVGVLASGLSFAQSTATSQGTINGFSFGSSATLPQGTYGTVTQPYSGTITRPGVTGTYSGSSTVIQTPHSSYSSSSGSVSVRTTR